MKVLVDYPSPEEEREIVYRMGSEPPVAETVLGPTSWSGCSGPPRRCSSTTRSSTTSSGWWWRRAPARARHGRRRHVGVLRRQPACVAGADRRQPGLALVRGRDYVLPQDVLDVTADVLRHRLVLSYDALADGVPADHIIKRIVQTVPLPQVAPRQNAGGFGPARHARGRPARAAARPRPAAARRARPHARAVRRRRRPTATRTGRTRRDPVAAPAAGAAGPDRPASARIPACSCTRRPRARGSTRAPVTALRRASPTGRPTSCCDGWS